MRLKNCLTKAEKRDLICPFNFNLRTWISAELFMEGYIHYNVTDTSIQIYKTPSVIIMDTLIDTNFVYSKKIKNHPSQLFFSKLKLDK